MTHIENELVAVQSEAQLVRAQPMPIKSDAKAESVVSETSRNDEVQERLNAEKLKRDKKLSEHKKALERSQKAMRSILHRHSRTTFEKSDKRQQWFNRMP